MFDTIMGAGMQRLWGTPIAGTVLYVAASFPQDLLYTSVGADRKSQRLSSPTIPTVTMTFVSCRKADWNDETMIQSESSNSLGFRRNKLACYRVFAYTAKVMRKKRVYLRDHYLITKLFRCFH